MPGRQGKWSMLAHTHEHTYAGTQRKKKTTNIRRLDFIREAFTEIIGLPRKRYGEERDKPIGRPSF